MMQLKINELNESETMIKKGPLKLGPQIRELRKKAGFSSPKTFTKAINRSNGFVTRMEDPDFDLRDMKLRDIQTVCEVINVPIDELLYDDTADGDISIKLNNESLSLIRETIHHIRTAIRNIGIANNNDKLDDFTDDGIAKLFIAEIFAISKSTDRDKIYEKLAEISTEKHDSKNDDHY